MEDLLLSAVIIAKKNTSLSFIRALNSILNQMYSPIKIYVVDANEPNSIYSLGLQEDLAAFPTVRYLQPDPSLSVAAIRNFMLQSAESDYISFLCSNDVWDSTKALLQMDQLKANPDAAASCSNGVLIDERKTEVAVDPLIEHLSFDTSTWLLNNPAKMSAQVIYKTAAVKDAGGFDEQFENYCDADMLLKLSRKGNVLLLPVSLCECYITPDNDSYDLNNLKDSRQILYNYMELFLENKRMAQLFYGKMISLAKLNYLWLNYFVYIFLYFIKAPGHTVFLFFKKTGLMIRYILTWIHRKLSLGKEYFRIRKSIHLIRKGKLDKIKALKPPVITAEESDAEPVCFASARHYNKKNSLDFAFDHKLESMIIPEYVTVIKKGMFYGCDRLVSITIPNTVLEIQAHAFHKCRKLRQVNLQEGSRLGKIGAYAFAGCNALETLSLSSGIVEIGKYAFAACPSLKQLLFTYVQKGEEKSGNLFPAALVKLSRYIFAGCTNLLSVEFGMNSMLETIETGAFLGCQKLQKIVLTGNIKSLGNYTFFYCKKLETVAIPQIDKLTDIGKCAFMYCEALDYFQFPNQIAHIHVRTFYGCSSLKQVKIPKKVLSINHQAFAKCTSLMNALILTGDITISPTAFDKHTKIQILENVNKDNF